MAGQRVKAEFGQVLGRRLDRSGGHGVTHCFSSFVLVHRLLQRTWCYVFTTSSGPHEVKADTDIFDTLEPVAKDVADLTPEWLNFALEHAGSRGNVSEARCEPIGIGQMGRSYRVTLTYSDEPAYRPVQLGGQDGRRRAGGPPAGSRWVSKRSHVLLSDR